MSQGPPQIEINWTGIVCLALVILTVVVIAKSHEQIGAFLGTMGRIGPGHTTDDQLIGLIAFGLVAVTIVGVVAILARNRHE